MHPYPVRRVVTGIDATGKAVVVDDSSVTDTLVMNERGVTYTELWRLPTVPVPVESWGERSDDEILSIAPLAGGVNFRVIQFDPSTGDHTESTDGVTAFDKVNSADVHVAGARHPTMHRTQTVDFGIVLSGSITLLLDEDDVELKAGDIVIQRATNHAWVNKGTEPCLIAFVLADGKVRSEDEHHETQPLVDTSTRSASTSLT